MSTYKLVCPYCYGALRIRTSVGQTPCFRSIYYECTSLVCGAKIAGTQTLDYELSPSGMAKPFNRLPIAPSAIRQKALRDGAKESNQMDLLAALEEAV